MKLGIALSGGGVKCAAHIGVIKALQENNIKIDAISGTSAGSVIASLFAMGYTPEEMLKLFKYFSKNILKAEPGHFITNVKNGKGIKLDGAFSGKNIEMALKETAILKNMENIKDLKVPIAIPTVDINQSKKYVFTNMKVGEEGYINDIDIGTAVRASCSYPGVFAPCDYKEYRFVDGGVLDNIPADEVKKLGVDKVLSVKFILSADVKPAGMYGITSKCLDIIFEGLAKPSIDLSDLVFDIDVSEASIFNSKQIDYCYNEGYKHAITKINELKDIRA